MTIKDLKLKRNVLSIQKRMGKTIKKATRKMKGVEEYE